MRGEMSSKHQTQSIGLESIFNKQTNVVLLVSTPVLMPALMLGSQLALTLICGEAEGQFHKRMD